MCLPVAETLKPYQVNFRLFQLAGYGSVKSIPKREFPIYYEKEKKLFQIVVRMSDAPGSLMSILEVLGRKVNLIATSTYTLGDGTAILSAFSEPLSSTETIAGIQKALGSSPVTIESDVTEGKGGLLVDTFHSGLQVGGEDYMLLRRAGLSGVFDHIVKIFGTGGEVLLYEEGLAMAQRNAKNMNDLLTPEVVGPNTSYLIEFLTAQGWGVFEPTAGKGSHEGTVKMSHCFECEHGSTVRKHCDFMRGYFEGSANFTLGVSMQVEELECALRGDKACIYRVTHRKKSGQA